MISSSLHVWPRNAPTHISSIASRLCVTTTAAIFGNDFEDISKLKAMKSRLRLQSLNPPPVFYVR
jgi:hypothetical protein